MKYSLLLLVIILGGCTAKPNLINGKYYMAGDSACARANSADSNTINCYNSKGEFQGIRHAMSDQELQMYMHKQTMNSQTPSYNYQPQKKYCNTSNGSTYCW